MFKSLKFNKNELMELINYYFLKIIFILLIIIEVFFFIIILLEIIFNKCKERRKINCIYLI